MSKKNLIILGIIVFIAAVLRLWNIGNVPISPDWDEVALGYNAYSILHTARDEYGKFLPIVLRSFDDYKPALYSYFAIPSIIFFGLNIFAVRLPSAIFGILTVIATYFLVKEIFSLRSTSGESLRNTPEVTDSPREAFSAFVATSAKEAAKRGWTPRGWIPLVAAFLLAISPWHIQFSRIAFESNVGLTFNIFSALFFLKGLKKPPFMILSLFLMVINIYIYQSEKVFTPLLFLSLVLIFRKEFFAISKKYLIFSFLTAILIALPMIFYTFTNKNALERAKGVSVFSQGSQLLEENSKKLLEDKKNNDYLGLILDNRRIIYAKTVVQGYLSHYDLNWLFVKGDIARHHAPNMGLLYLFELPFLFIGIYNLIFGDFDKKTKLIIFSWFLIAPIPASITSGVPHAVRTLNFLPTLQIFVAIGIIFALQKISNIKYQILKIHIKYLIFTLCILFFIFNFLYYLNQYFVQQNYFNASEWQYGYVKATAEIQKIEKNYSKIIVSNQPPMDQSYMFFLFYLKYPPDLYQKESINSSGGFRENHTFGKFEFRPINWNEDSGKNNTLFVGRPGDFPSDINIIDTVYYPNGKKAILIND